MSHELQRTANSRDQAAGVSNSNNPEQLEDLHLTESGHALNAMTVPVQKEKFLINSKFSQQNNF